MTANACRRSYLGNLRRSFYRADVPPTRLLLLVSIACACGPTKPDQTSDDPATSSSSSAGAGSAATTADTPPGPTSGPDAVTSDPTLPPETSINSMSGVSLSLSDSITAVTTTAPSDPTVPSTTADPDTDSTTGEPVPCDLSLQDCPEGQKCSVYAMSVDDLLQGMFKCVPVVPNPQPPHAPCDVFSDPADGTDDCALGSICLFPDAEGIGECFAFCNDSQEPICSTPGDVCVGPFCQSCMWTYCDVHCDILDPNTCAAGEVCAPTSEGPWQCFFDSSGDAGAPGDPCTALNACDPGNICLEPAAVPGCTSDSGCCAPACDVNAQGPCPDDGSQCVPWYDEGLAPTPELAEVGVCRLP